MSAVDLAGATPPPDLPPSGWHLLVREAPTLADAQMVMEMAVAAGVDPRDLLAAQEEHR